MSDFFLVLSVFFIGWQVGLAAGAYQISQSMARQGARGTVSMGVCPLWLAMACFILSIVLH